jgi:hypothetical protein
LSLRSWTWHLEGVTARRILYPLRLVRARLARRLGRIALVGLGLAAAAATLAAVLAGSLVAQDRSVGRALNRIPEPQRAVRALWFGVPGETDKSHPELDRAADSALGPLDVGSPTRVLLFRRASIGGALVDLGAADNLGRWVRLSSGRLPKRCEPERCEVLRIRGIPGPLPKPAGITIVQVGEASLRSDVLFGEFVAPGSYHQPNTPPLVVAEGVDTFANADSLGSLYRSYGWVLPLGAGSVRVWDAKAFPGRVERARSTLQVAQPGFQLDAPTDKVREAADTASASGRRLLLIGGEACALLVAFALLAAATLRRDVTASRRRLSWFGARRWQLELGTGAESVVIAAGGTIVGWLAGIALAGAIADRAGLPVGAVLSHSVLSQDALVAGLVLAAASALVLFLAVRARPVQVRGLALTPVDVAALGAVAVIVTALARGSTDANALAREGGTGALLLLLPGLVAFVAAVVFARALGPALRGLERLARRRAVPLRMAALSLARHSGYASIAIAFLTVSLGLALFAETYRSTLARGQGDQAAYAVPPDAIASEDLRELVPVLQAAPLERYAEATHGGTATSVLRMQGSVARLSTRGVTLLGLPPKTIASVGGWRGDFASRSREELAALVDPGKPVSLNGPALGDDARELRLRASVEQNPLSLQATIATPAETFVTLPLGSIEPGKPVVLHADIPPEARGGKLVGLTFLPPRRIEETGATAGQAARGMLTTGPLQVVGASDTRAIGWNDWLPTSPGISAIVSGPETQFHFALTNQVYTRFRPEQASDAGPVPVLVTPRLAAAAGPHGALSVDVGSGTLTARVAGVIERMPTVNGDAVVVDRDLAVTALNATNPGAVAPNEIWLDAGPGQETRMRSDLLAPPFDPLDVSTRAGVIADLRADPLARAALLTLASAALVALALALVGLLLGVVADLRDERGELYDLESQGASPAALRRQVRLRAAIVASAGLIGGAVTGAVLSALVVGLVRLTANAARPQPPLLVSVDWRLVALAVVAYALLAALLVGFATARAFRAPAPARISGAEA